MSTFTLKIAKKEGLIYDGKAALVTMPGILGDIGFLPHHAPYVVGLKEGAIKIYSQEKGLSVSERTFFIKSGHAYFHSNDCFLCVCLKKEEEKKIQ